MTDQAAIAKGKLREIAIWLAWLFCVALAAFALDQLAHYQLREHLRDSAAKSLGALVHGDTPWRWSMRSASDVIAGRAFGSNESEFSRDGFRITSQGEAFEVGLVLDRTLDLHRYPRIEGQIKIEHAAPLTVILRTHFDQPLCRSTPVTINPGTTNFSIDLRTIAWQCSDDSTPIPATAAMLRLGFELGKGQSATIADVRFLPDSAPSLDSLATISAVELPSASDRPAFSAALKTAQVSANHAAWPLFALTGKARVEQMLVAHDLIREQSPAALVIAEEDLNAVRAAAANWSAPERDRVPAWLIWAALLLYVSLLALLRFKPAREAKPRALYELLGVIGLPLLLVTGGLIGDDISLPVQLAAGASFLFALSLLIGAAPASPTARTARRGSWLALISVIIAIAVVLIARDGSLQTQIPNARQIAQYLAWAAIQQFLICVIVADRLERLLGSQRWALLLAALVFALLHTPNAALMQFTYLGGLIWIWNWQRHRGLLPNILAHAACGILLASQLPIDWLRSAEVSARYFF